MEQFKATSDSELAIMNTLWNAEKGLVQQRKQGRGVFYAPKMTFKEYESNRAKSILMFTPKKKLFLKTK